MNALASARLSKDIQSLLNFLNPRHKPPRLRSITEDIKLAMANHAIIKRIDAAVNRLCNDLHAIYTNFFDSNTLQTTQSQITSPRRVIPIGTYACDVWTADEDIHLVCISNNSSETFWNYLKENLRLDEDAKLPRKHDPAVIELSAPKLSRKTDASRCCLHEFAELSLKNQAGCKFYLHYAQAPKTTVDRILTDVMPLLSMERQWTSAIYNNIIVRDIQLVARDFKQSKSDFRSLIYQIRAWARFHGLVGAKLSFLSSNDIVWLAHGTCVANKSTTSTDLLKSDSLLEEAINRLKELVCSRSISESSKLEKTLCRTTHEEQLRLRLSLEAKTAIHKAGTYIQPTDSDELNEPQDPFWIIMSEFDSFLKVECESWAPKLHTRADFQENVVPSCLVKLTEALRKEQISLRIWPVPLVRTNDYSSQTFAIGINGSAELCLDQVFLKYVLDYDSKIGLIRATLATREDFKSVHASSSRLPTISDDDFSGDDFIHDFNAKVNLSTPMDIPESTKFRTAHAAISRLSYDPKHASVEYEVGYEDRFDNELMWMPLEEWGGKAVEDENFVPEHRVRQLRRSKDKGVVWDRLNRVDLT